MQPGGFDFYAIGDAALELGVARSNLRYYIDLGKVPCRRASDGSRLMSHDDVKAARAWISAHEAEKARAKETARKSREDALRRIKNRGARAKRRA
jgi:DNA-binding transcriptional MerR regulator